MHSSQRRHRPRKPDANRLLLDSISKVFGLHVLSCLRKIIQDAAGKDTERLRWALAALAGVISDVRVKVRMLRCSAEGALFRWMPSFKDPGHGC